MPEESDWRSVDAYSYLDDLDSAAFAWEFLRRNSEYQQAYRSVLGEASASPEMSEPLARRWGLSFRSDPNLRADRAPIVWLPDLNPATVLVAPAPKTFTEASPIGRLTLVFSRRAADGEHLLVDDGGDRLPVVLINGADAATPAAVMIPLDGRFAVRAEAALRLWRAATGQIRGRSPDRLTTQQRRRLGLTLRALDGRLAGHPYRVVAQVLFGETRVPTGPDWKTHDLRDRTIRLCRRGLKLMRGGYLNLLRHPRQFRG